MFRGEKSSRVFDSVDCLSGKDFATRASGKTFSIRILESAGGHSCVNTIVWDRVGGEGRMSVLPPASTPEQNPRASGRHVRWLVRIPNPSG